MEDNYQKQTYRNRCYICTDQGIHMLNIPIRHAGGKQGRQKYKEVRLENSYLWQRQHWRTLQMAYRTSPFFEYYEDELAPLYQEPQSYLLDFNFKTIEAICGCLQVAMPLQRTSRYEKSPSGLTDARGLVNAKTGPRSFNLRYGQVFEDRHGFIPNLSVLDLLFNLGTTAVLELQQLDIPLEDG